MFDRSDGERRDICAAAASVETENIAAFEIALAFPEKLGGDTFMAVGSVYEGFLSAVRSSRRDR